ncbi:MULTISPECIES: ABC transporter permease [unclassified Acidocella]|uniref:ABC transporter permease n=1 Tax=unclassified Acidocella TaxID=2648610 RepID=UPI00028D9F14|nr:MULTISPECIES: ABC transporter permease [unclassified Acidocella]EKM98558.1 sugar ABC transporter permease [Acidocella sp. MX-AZ02]WBO59062.1 ABC transporter permease [Acidocella sp. MX-AZ03]
MRKVGRLKPLPHEAGLGLLTLALLALVTLLFPQFLAPDNVKSLLDDTALLIMMAVGEMFVLLTRGVDLSVAANAALTGMVVAQFNAAHPQAGVVPVLLIALAMGAGLGLFNGLLVWRLRLPSIVVTLGTLSIYRGCVYLVSGGAWVNSGQMSPAFLDFVRLPVLGLSMLSWIGFGTAGLGWLFLRYSNAGRNLYAAGNNPEAAAYAGIDVGRMQCLAFLLSGTISGLAGYLWTARFGVAYTDVASGFELQVIAACVIGGVSITGGVGGIAGVVLGGLFLGIIKTALPVVGISPFFQLAVSGLVITVAVILNSTVQRKTHGRKILEPAEAAS